MDLKNAVVLITGGSSGIGRAAARVLTQAGARVAITGRDAERLSEVASSLGVLGIQADVADEGDVMRTFREVKEKLGDLDVLVNNAGIGVLKELVDQDRGSFDAVFATNVTGVMLMSREAARLFKERKGGNIVNISSTASLRGAPKGTAYYASKFALRGMTECWRAELRKYNVRVFLINPSEVITDFARRAGLPQADNATKLRSDDITHDQGSSRNEQPRLHSRTLNLRDESHRLSGRGCRPRGALIFSIIGATNQSGRCRIVSMQSNESPPPQGLTPRIQDGKPDFLRCQASACLLRHKGKKPARIVYEDLVNRFFFHAGGPHFRHEDDHCRIKSCAVIGLQFVFSSEIRPQQHVVLIAGVNHRQDHF